MSKIIAVTSGKGGTGKSSISACLGYALAKQGNRTLIIELDESEKRSMTARNGITNGSLCALNILRLTAVTRKTESYTKTKCSAESVIPQSIFSL